MSQEISIGGLLAGMWKVLAGPDPGLEQQRRREGGDWRALASRWSKCPMGLAVCQIVASVHVTSWRVRVAMAGVYVSAAGRRGGRLGEGQGKG